MFWYVQTTFFSLSVFEDDEGMSHWEDWNIINWSRFQKKWYVSILNTVCFWKLWLIRKLPMPPWMLTSCCVGVMYGYWLTQKMPSKILSCQTHPNTWMCRREQQIFRWVSSWFVLSNEHVEVIWLGTPIKNTAIHDRRRALPSWGVFLTQEDVGCVNSTSVDYLLFHLDPPGDDPEFGLEDLFNQLVGLNPFPKIISIMLNDINVSKSHLWLVVQKNLGTLGVPTRNSSVTTQGIWKALILHRWIVWALWPSTFAWVIFELTWKGGGWAGFFLHPKKWRKT